MHIDKLCIVYFHGAYVLCVQVYVYITHVHINIRYACTNAHTQTHIRKHIHAH